MNNPNNIRKKYSQRDGSSILQDIPLDRIVPEAPSTWLVAPESSAQRYQFSLVKEVSKETGTSRYILELTSNRCSLPQTVNHISVPIAKAESTMFGSETVEEFSETIGGNQLRVLVSNT